MDEEDRRNREMAGTGELTPEEIEAARTAAADALVEWREQSAAGGAWPSLPATSSTRLLSPCFCLAVVAWALQMLPATPSTRMLSPHLLSYTTSCDVASDIGQAHRPPRHRHAFLNPLCVFAVASFDVASHVVQALAAGAGSGARAQELWRKLEHLTGKARFHQRHPYLLKALT